MEKNEAINNLYAIRAGLSTISVNYDKMIEIKETVEKMQTSIRDQKQETNHASQSLESLKSEERRLDHEIKSTEDKFKEENKSLEARRKEIESELNSRYRTSSDIKKSPEVIKQVKINSKKAITFIPEWADSCLMNIIIWVGSFILLYTIFGILAREITEELVIELVYTIGKPFGFEWDLSDYDMFPVIFVSVILMYPAFLLIRFILAKIFSPISNLDSNLDKYAENYLNYNYQLLKERDEIDNKLGAIQKEISDLKTRRYTLLMRRSDAQKAMSGKNSIEHLRELESSNKPFYKESQKKIDAYAKENKLIKQALINNYSAMLDISDWENIDLIIYYLNTNRADTIKEALQLVDRQKQMNSIVDAINHAGRSISNTISQGFNSIQSSLSLHFKNLSAKISSIETAIEDTNRQNAIAANAINNQLISLVDESKIQSAFIKKADRRIERMIEDMKNSDNKITLKID